MPDYAIACQKSVGHSVLTSKIFYAYSRAYKYFYNSALGSETHVIPMAFILFDSKVK